MTWPTESAGRWLERAATRVPEEMIVIARKGPSHRIPLIGLLHTYRTAARGPAPAAFIEHSASNRMRPAQDGATTTKNFMRTQMMRGLMEPDSFDLCVVDGGRAAFRGALAAGEGPGSRDGLGDRIPLHGARGHPGKRGGARVFAAQRRARDPRARRWRRATADHGGVRAADAANRSGTTWGFALALVEDSLSREGVYQPTPDQLEARYCVCCRCSATASSGKRIPEFRSEEGRLNRPSPAGRRPAKAGLFSSNHFQYVL